MIPSAGSVIWPDQNKSSEAQKHTADEKLEDEEKTQNLLSQARVDVDLLDSLELQIKIIVASSCGTAGLPRNYRKRKYD